jgi:hypothetical protein
MKTKNLIPLLSVGLVACGGDLCDDVSLEKSANVATIMNFSWPGEGAGTLEWGYEEGVYDYAIDAGEGESHAASVLGATALTEVYYRVVNLLDGKENECVGNTSTLNSPSNIANLNIDSYDADLASEEPYLLGTAMLDDSSIVAIDREGNTVWYKSVPRDILTTEVAFAHGSNDLVYNSYADSYDIDIGEVYRITPDHEEVAVTRIEEGHHFFEELPDGTIAYMKIDVRDVIPGKSWTIDDCDKELRSTNKDGVEVCSVVGHEIVEVPADGGDPVTLLSTFDFLEVIPYDDWNLGFYPQGMSWLHSNALNYDADRDTYMWSFAGYDTFVEVSRDGSLVRTFGDFGDYKPNMKSIPAYDDGFDFQHDPHWTVDGTILTFVYDDDNGCYAVEFEVDDKTKMLNEVWSYGRDLNLRAHALGMARRLKNGNTLVNWGTAGVVREVTPSGEIAWEAYSNSGTFFGSTQMVSDLYAGE